MTSESNVNVEARIFRIALVGQHVGRLYMQPSGLPDTPRELAGNVVPDLVRLVLKHASPRHDVEILTG